MFLCFELNGQTAYKSYESLQHWNSKLTPDKWKLPCVPEDGSIYAVYGYTGIM